MSMVSEGLACEVPAFKLTQAEKEKLWRLFQPAVQHLAGISAAMLGFVSVTDGDDVVQEVFLFFARRAVQGELKCLENRRVADIGDHELEQYIPLCRRYLSNVTACKSYEFHRRIKSRRNGTGRWLDTVKKKEVDPLIGLIHQEQVDNVQQTVLRLPPHLRKILVLRFHEQRSLEEIAAILTITARTVQRHLRDLLEQLRILLPSDMIEDEQPLDMGNHDLFWQFEADTDNGCKRKLASA
jgi:RNA polymerase sigma factor (sigma-70 family)